MKKPTIVTTSGYFLQLHVGHVRLFKEAKKLGDKLIVILNSDKQMMMKYGYVLQPEQERKEVIEALECVDEVFISIDDDRTQCKTLEYLKPNIFAKGGDRNADNIPETPICEKYGIEIVNNVGGGKIQSSSWLINKVLEYHEKVKIE